MPAKRQSGTAIKDPTLLEMGKPEEAGQPANSLKIERPYSLPGTVHEAVVYAESLYEAVLRGLKLRKLLGTGYTSRW